MFIGNSFGKTMDILHRTMDVQTIRSGVIANNIANADTPNFKRTTVNFESELERALDSEKIRKLPARITNSRHIPFNRVIDYRTVRPRRVLDFATATDNNGNNVDLEEESMRYLNNQLAYTLATNSVASLFNQINTVVR
ncbi:MAG: flagellar basal body rod protein FlgB [Spirochaetia bacterium]